MIRCGLFQSHPANRPTVSATSNSTSAASSGTSSSGASQPTLDSNGFAVDGAATSRTTVPAAPLTVTDKVSPDVQFSAGKKGTVGSWTVENIKSNTVIMQCELLINGRQVAKSVPMKPNQHINSITLSDDVATGTYKATAVIQYFSLSTGEYISQTFYQIHLTVR